MEIALSKSSSRKASGPSEVSAVGEYGIDCLQYITKDEWNMGKRPYGWRKSEMVPIYKQKGDRGINLMEHAMKVLERVVDKGLGEIVDIDGVQFGFMKGKGTTHAIWIVRQIQENMLVRNNNLNCAFVDLEKAFDRVHRQ